jgi:hypothetical protein
MTEDRKGFRLDAYPPGLKRDATGHAPIRPLPAQAGDLNFICPGCGRLLAEGWSESGIRGLTFQCGTCQTVSTGNPEQLPPNP